MKLVLGTSGVLLAISGLLSAYLFANPVEESMAPHWAIPLVGLICFFGIPAHERRSKPQNREKGYWSILLCVPILGILFQLHYLSHISWLSGFQSPLIPIMGLHVFLILVGNFVITSKSIISGIPTPWNLRSKMSWRKSHRLCGYGLVGLGIVNGAATLIKGEFQDGLLGLGMLGLFFVFAVYSWWVWRGDPDREPIFGTV